MSGFGNFHLDISLLFVCLTICSFYMLFVIETKLNLLQIRAKTTVPYKIEASGIKFVTLKTCLQMVMRDS